MSIKCKLVHNNAILPAKAGPSEIGYDITAIELDKMYNENTYMFDTGVQVQPPPGYYLELIPRSSIIKSGYMLTNSVGIIDPTYRGNIKIVLTKVEDGAQKLEVPFTKCQLVLRRIHDARIEEIDDNLEQTERGDGGFGSTD